MSKFVNVHSFKIPIVMNEPSLEDIDRARSNFGNSYDQYLYVTYDIQPFGHNPNPFKFSHTLAESSYKTKMHITDTMRKYVHELLYVEGRPSGEVPRLDFNYMIDYVMFDLVVPYVGNALIDLTDNDIPPIIGLQTLATHAVKKFTLHSMGENVVPIITYYDEGSKESFRGEGLASKLYMKRVNDIRIFTHIPILTHVYHENYLLSDGQGLYAVVLYNEKMMSHSLTIYGSLTLFPDTTPSEFMTKAREELIPVLNRWYESI